MKFPKKLLAMFLALTLVFSMSGTSVFAAGSNSYYNATYNHGTMAITANDSSGTITITEGESAVITVSPYMHVQYRGCMMDFDSMGCPEVCGGVYCFTPGKGCCCDPTPVTRTATVNASAADTSVVTVGAAAAAGQIGSGVGKTVDGTIALTANKAGETTVEVTAQLYHWAPVTKTYTVVVAPKLVSIEVTEAPKNYATGESFSTKGVTVVATYSDGSTKVIENYDVSNSGALTKDDTAITISYTENGITKTENVTINVQDPIEIVDYDVYTTHGGEVTNNGTLDTQVAHVSLTFAEAMKIVDAEDLVKEMADTICWNNSSTPISSSNIAVVGDVKLSSDGKTLSFTLSNWVAAFSGIIKSSGAWKNLVTDDEELADAGFKMMMPNGTQAIIIDQVIADENTNASVTVKFTADENTTRGMVHFIVLKNGQPVTPTNLYGGNVVGHWHNYLSMTAENFVAGTGGMGASLEKTWKNSSLANDYTITDINGDTFTLVANNSKPGDVIEFHVLSYLNDGSKTIDKSKLDATIAAAKNAAEDFYTAENYAELQDVLYLAEVMATDTTYYAQTDVDSMTAKLQAAVDNVIVKTPAADKDNSEAADDSTATGDDTNLAVLFALMLASAGMATGIFRRRKAE